MNKFARKASALLFAGALFAQAGMGAMALDINISGQGLGSSYQAFRLLDLKTSLKATGHDGHDENVHGDDCWNYAYTVPTKYRSYLQAAMGDDDATDTAIIDYIRDLDADGIRTFADTIYKAMVAANVDFDAEVTAAEDAKTATLTVAEQGYYLVSEATVGSDPDSRSLVMLNTLGSEDIDVNTKESIPSVTKKIIENGKEVDALDVDAADEVEFSLKGTLPDNIASYATYHYEFHDTMSAGLAVKDGTMTVTIDGAAAEIGDGKDFVYTNADGVISVKCVDLKAVATKLGKTLSGTSVVELKYKATLDKDAVSGTTGNPNTAKLEFSNDPYSQGEGKTSTTPEDKVQVFTYDVVINKTDGADQPLKGANFKLQKKNAEGNFVDFRTNTFNAEQTTFRFDALDAGEYQIVETTVPEGYNGAEPIAFEIRATYDATSDDPKLTDLKVFIGGVEQAEDGPFTVNITSGEVSTAIVNNTGTKLPSTGGAGVYGFYIGGSVLVAGGVGAMIFIHKRKKNVAE